MNRTVWLLGIMLLTSQFTGCNPNPVKGASISPKQAMQVAQKNYKIDQVEHVELRALTEDELKQVPKSGEHKTPIYYVVKGKDAHGNNLVVFVSSNDEHTHFKQTR